MTETEPRNIKTIGIFAPSSSFPEDRYQNGLSKLKNLGFGIVEPEGLRKKQGYLAGDDSHRVRLLHSMLENEEIDCIWAARGGYGLHRIIDKIDIQKLKASNKLIVGFSDICALHALVQKETNGLSIHGPVVTQLSNFDSPQLRQVEEVVRNEWSQLTYESSKPSIVRGKCDGILVGGCLSVITPLLGTPYMPPLDDSILLLEDVGETVYRIDRLLQHLRLAGVFKRVRGIALGEFYNCEPRNDNEPNLQSIFEDILGDVSVPVLNGLPFGHGHINQAIPLGARAFIETNDSTGKLVVNRDG
ncbi:MAG: LD-carboxypeptidase [Myxococcota bacterium]|nr:LD-carboxypeptidase [Myxococcota bacterium]